MSVKSICQQVPVIPVLVVNDVSIAQPLAQALVNGGLHVLEVTLRTAVALEVIHRMSEVPGSIVGAGTVLTPADVKAVKAAGAAFAVSPGATERLLAAAEDEGLALLPGVATVSEVMKLVERGFDTLKFFPAEAAGGVKMLKSIHGPLPDVRFCPTGGISVQTFRDYLVLPNVLCVGGSWLTPADKIAAQDWAGIEAMARFNVDLVKTQ
ncbi:MAG: 2-dehydro-3-deoxyphosphogluconate aldolase/4-hydroxy-2-oxoglutarate aldolase [Pseudomonadota bacterium]|jgi:2-dehydro-3-deoxyphosphogluconate aldolase/(4S)-4-hydroxy-2-oxoglutarate aldolase|uniref:2-dehydro-3-deoxy-phosphogluconate aldolase n=1 Tax=Thiothrix fructosivorans TaxID=111770 RepID=A0A8B0SJX8_9GAMM|nr:bifunctional 4-hydroxy-2-oxoglutarate aldolase/2-dehydro-3-deoxy-phosphogluconate aldolase [Thiothrix fructosivorans]MBO0614008.1 bifunctional 4-hydroxy-2-oxoglutarate aldolase/2-dehydro-3-deoxy-phosphogluconate aldolase [Thiothrix fructosivorans]QTX10368.1 bifunctional 4-hydroxy-2-oxoglutarate aldolase/2-dehydro-3-deoxy-phosphogluconate aldolase [Thiothrix fructosivorans]